MNTQNETDPIFSTPEFLKRSITARQFALRVGVSPTTVQKWLEEGLPSGMIGARRLIHIDTADIWLKAKIGIETGFEAIKGMANPEASTGDQDKHEPSSADASMAYQRRHRRQVP